MLATLGLWVTQAQATTYTQTTPNFAAGSLSFPGGVAVDAAGDLFVVNPGTPAGSGSIGGNVVELTAAGKTVTLPFAADAFDNPGGIAVDSKGDVFVTDAGNADGTGNKVVELTAAGNTVFLPFPAGLPVGPGIAVNSAGDVFVTTGGGVSELTTFDQTVTLPFAAGSLVQPGGIAIDSAGDVFVANNGLNNVIELTAAGKTVTVPFAPGSFNGSGGVTEVALDSAGNLYATVNNDFNPISATVVELTTAGKTLTLPFSAGSLDPSYGLAVDANGDVFASSLSNSTVVELRALKTPTVTWSPPAAITYGTPLSGAQLDATASVPGTFTYTPPAGTVLGGGVQSLSVLFTPTDSTDYAAVNASVPLTVLRAPTKLTVPALPLGSASATLTRSDTGAAVTGETVVFRSDGTTVCSATTNSSGTATCSLSLHDRLLLLVFGYQANFAGDSNYLPSAASAGL